MVASRAKGALWGANASSLQSLAISDMYRDPTLVEVTLDFRGSANETPAKVRTASALICNLAITNSCAPGKEMPRTNIQSKHIHT